MSAIKEKIILAKNKILVVSASASALVFTTATNAFAEEAGVTVDYAQIATNTQSSIVSAINSMLPTLAVLFGTVAAVKFAPRLIKKFFG